MSFSIVKKINTIYANYIEDYNFFIVGSFIYDNVEVFISEVLNQKYFILQNIHILI